VIALIHGMTRRAVAVALHLTYQGTVPNAADELMEQLRGAFDEGTSALPLAGPDDLMVVCGTPPFNMLLEKLSVEVR
jgi:hypothetical protein